MMRGFRFGFHLNLRRGARSHAAVYRSATLLLVAAFFAVGTASAQAPGAFARLPFDARTLALGGGLAADRSGEASAFLNPSLAPYVGRQSLSASAALMTFGRQWQSIQISAPMRPRAGIAAGLVRGAVTGIDGRDASGFATGEFATEEFAFFLAFGLKLGERVSGGLALQLFRTDLFDGVKPVISLGIDLGVTARVTDEITLALVADDLLARYRWDTAPVYGDAGRSTTDNFPRRLRLGLAYAPEASPLRVFGEAESRVTTLERRDPDIFVLRGEVVEGQSTEDLSIQDWRARVGAEYQIAEMLHLRAGLDRLFAGDLAEATPSFGFGVTRPLGTIRAHAEYAVRLEPYAVGTMHLVTLRLEL